MIRIYRPFAWVALKNPRTTVAIGLFAILSAIPMAFRLGHEFMPPLNEGDLLYMPTTFPNISIEEARRSLQMQDRLIRSVPEVERVFGKAGRAETATDPAPLSMVETTVKLKPEHAWPLRVAERRWYSDWAPGGLAAILRPVWPERRRVTWDELVTELNDKVRMPGWTNAWIMPIKTRIDMLSTGIRTPVGIKILGANLDTLERIGVDLERIVSRVPATRSVYSERNTGGFYVDIEPDRERLARYGLTLGDVQDVIEAAIGGQPIEVAIAGRARYSINVRYPRELRQDVESLRRVWVPLPTSGPTATSTLVASRARSATTDGMSGGMEDGMGSASASPGRGTGTASPTSALVMASGRPRIPLGQIARVSIVTGPPMIRDESGLLAGYVYVDLDAAQRDIGGYVDDAKRRVARELRMPPGYSLKWTGQYELLEQMQRRMVVLAPLALAIIMLLLYFSLGSLSAALIVMASVPFALVGSVWLLAWLGYNLSTAVWVGIIALVGLAAQTGIVMMVYCDTAYRRRLREGRIRNLEDIIEATLEGSVQRVRPKLMTVGTMLVSLVPLLWSDGAGADVMKRVAAPMVGGLVTSAFLTLEIIPVVYAYWRYAQLRRSAPFVAEGNQE
jgi:Cu(I)/Ag(I) efflux system membrane protein CusA/SilA